MIVNRERTGEATGVRVAELVIPTLKGHEPKPAVSVIVPVTERPEPLAELFLEYSEPLATAGLAYEFVFVVEPRNRKRVEPLRKLAERGQSIRVFEVGHTVGESLLLMLGAARSRADTLIVLPAYRRVDASALPELYMKIFEGADLVNCRRNPRRDSWLNRLQTRVLHTLVAGLASGRVRDVGSGVRAMRREVLSEIPLYGDFFRFLPVLAIREGYQVEEIDAPQHSSDAKTRVYSPGIYLRRLIDVGGLFFLARFTFKPLRFFGMIGGTLVMFGGLILFVLFLQRLAGEPLAGRPLLLLGVLVFTLGVQAIALGLIGEIIVHFNAPKRSPYRIRVDTAAEESLTTRPDPVDTRTSGAIRTKIRGSAGRTVEG